MAGAAEDDVPEVDEAEPVGKLDPAQTLVIHLDSPGSGNIVDGEAGGDGAMVAGGAAQRLQRLDPEPGPVLEGAAIFVGATVEMPRQGVGRKHPGGAVDVENVEAGIDCPLPRFGIHQHQPLDIVLARLIGIDLGDAARRKAVEGSRDIARGEVVLDPAGPQLHPGQRAPAMHFVGHVAMIDDIALVPDGRAGRCRLIDLGMDRAGLGADAGPASFRLHGPVGEIAARPEHAGAGALRHLVEAVLQDLRSDADRLEQRVVARIARHDQKKVRTAETTS